jgi:DNA-binding transcriptional MerR regulator
MKGSATTDDDSSAERRFTLAELAALANLPRRTVRYYIQIGLLDPPIGETRAAYYTSAHLEQLLTVTNYSKAGLSLERIRDLLHQPQLPPPIAPPRVGSIEVRSHLAIADGVELVIEPGRAQLSPEHVRKLFKETLALYAAIVEENGNER